MILMKKIRVIHLLTNFVGGRPLSTGGCGRPIDFRSVFTFVSPLFECVELGKGEIKSKCISISTHEVGSASSEL